MYKRQALEALVKAYIEGYETNLTLLESASYFLIRFLKEVRSIEDASTVFNVLCFTAAMGIIETEEIVEIGNFLVPLMKKPPLYWHWITSLDIELDYEGPLMEYEPPRLVEDDTMRVRISIINQENVTLNLSVKTILPTGCKIVEEKSECTTILGKQIMVYDVLVKAPRVVEKLTPVTITFVIYEDNIPIRARHINLELARNAKLEMVSKQVNPKELYLGEEAIITVKLRNSGDAPASTVAIAEELGDGFLVLTEKSPNESIASIIAVGVFPIARIEPGATIAYSFRIKADSPPGGNVLASLTKITYLDPLGNINEVEKAINLTVKRPEIILHTNVSELLIPWHKTIYVQLNVTNKGNIVAKNVSVRIVTTKDLTIPEVLNIGSIEPNTTKTVTLRIKSGWFYLHIKKCVPLYIIAHYDNQRVSHSISITFIMWDFAKLTFALIFGLILIITILQVRYVLIKRKKSGAPPSLLFCPFGFWGVESPGASWPCIGVGSEEDGRNGDS
mgnify:CR=1 FL=1